MQEDVERVREAYRLLRSGDSRVVAQFVDPEATWEPERRTARRRSENGEELTERWLYRAKVHRLRVTEAIDLGNSVLVTLAGRRMQFLGARWWSRNIFQLVTLRDGRILRLADFRTREDAIASLGLPPVRS